MPKKLTKDKPVTLVCLETFTPYKANEIATFPESIARKLLRVNMTQTDFGPRYSRVKWRLYDIERDEALQLHNNVLNQEEHNKLLKRLHPEIIEEDEPDIEDMEGDEEDRIVNADQDEDDQDLSEAFAEQRSSLKPAKKMGRPKKQ